MEGKREDLRRREEGTASGEGACARQNTPVQARGIPNGWEESPQRRWVDVAVPKAPSSWSATEWVQLFAEEAGVGCRQRLRRNSRLRNLRSGVVARVTRSVADGYPRHHGEKQETMPAAEDAKA